MELSECRLCEKECAQCYYNVSIRNSTCKLCKRGYYLDYSKTNITCDICGIQNCARCTHKYICEECFDGFRKWSNSYPVTDVNYLHVCEACEFQCL